VSKRAYTPGQSTKTIDRGQTFITIPLQSISPLTGEEGVEGEEGAEGGNRQSAVHVHVENANSPAWGITGAFVEFKFGARTHSGNTDANGNVVFQLNSNAPYGGTGDIAVSKRAYTPAQSTKTIDRGQTLITIPLQSISPLTDTSSASEHEETRRNQ